MDGKREQSLQKEASMKKRRSEKGPCRAGFNPIDLSAMGKEGKHEEWRFAETYRPPNIISPGVKKRKRKG